MSRREWALAVSLEAVGCCIGIVGLGVEIAMRAPLGYIIITVGLLAIATGSLLFAKVFKGIKG